MDGKDDALMPEAGMKEMDKDNDSFLSLAELTDEEMEEKDKKQMENLFNIADADKDGKLSAAELPVAMKEFESLSETEGEDAENHQDDDESLSETEGEDGENHQDDDGMDGKDDELSSDDIMRETDKDKDGFLSLVELMDEEMEEKDKKLIEKAFNKADADKDGKLSAAEVPVAMKEFESL